MKKFLLLGLTALFLASCGNSSKTTSSSKSPQISSESSSISSEESVSSSMISSMEESSESIVESSESKIESYKESELSSLKESSDIESSEESSKFSSESKTESSEISSEISSESSSEISSEESVSSESIISSEVIESSSEEKEDLLNPLDEPYIAKQYYLNHIGDIYSSWKEYRGKGVTIAVIDMGFNPYHEDFYYQDGTSKVSPLSASFSYTNKKVTTSVGVDKVVNMGESHGTFCAGVAAAAVNGKGVAGIAPEATLMLLKTDARPKSICEAFRYAADNGAKVITISIGSYYNYVGDLVDDGSDLGTVFEAPVQYAYNKGVVVCSAAGNGGYDDPTEYTFPGATTHVIGAGGLAANSSTELWEGSSYNSSKQYQFCDVFAPADGMFGCCHYDNKVYDGGWNGTSFASPIIAGAAALYFEKYPNKTNQNFETDLFNSCVKLNSSKIATVNQTGYGRIDIGTLLGTKCTDKVTIKVQSNWNTNYLYIWNSISGKALSSWPGKSVTKKNGYLELEVDLASYDSVIVTKSNSGPQSADLLLSSLNYDHYYSMNSTVSENGFLLGKYLPIS